MLLKNAGIFRVFSGLTVAETAKLTGIDEGRYLSIEKLAAEASAAETGALAALYNAEAAELIGGDDGTLSLPKTDEWHFFPPNEEIHSENIVTFKSMSFHEKELIAAFRSAPAEVKEAVYKTLTDKAFAQLLIEAERLEQKRLLLDLFEEHLKRREGFLDEREATLLKLLFSEASSLE